MSARLPRAPSQVVVLSRDVWDETCSRIERLEKLRVAAPLEMRDTPGGPLLSISERSIVIYRVVLTAATVVGGLYQCNVYDSATGAVLDAAAAGALPTAFYGTAFRTDSGHPTDSSTFYALNDAESNFAQWTLLGNTRGPFKAVDLGRRASDGTRILELLSEFAPGPCATGPSAGESMASIGI